MAATLSGARSATHARLADFFRDRKTRAGVLARRVHRAESPDDAELTEHLVRERRRRTRIDGSVDGALVPTAWVALEMLQLNCPPDHAGVVRTVGFLLGRQDQPGRIFGEGCRPELHERGLCAHYVGGFFSAGPEEHALAPVTFPIGLVAAGEYAARFAASCFTLRTAMRASEDRRQPIHRHVASLLDLESLWSGEASWASPDLMFFALGAVASAPLDLRERAAQAARQVIAQQQPDGSWRGADLFHALDMLLFVPTAEAREAIRRSVPLVCTLAQEAGSLEGEAGEERGLVALRALALAG